MKRILSVDDSASVRQMVSFTLRKAGYEVEKPATDAMRSPRHARRNST